MAVETTEETTTTTEAPPPRPLPNGDSLEEKVAAGERRPQEISARRGDRLTLLVDVREPSEVLIRRLGESAFAVPNAPARFDLLLRDVGTYAVSLADGTTVARINVASAEAGDAGAEGEDPEAAPPDAADDSDARTT